MGLFFHEKVVITTLITFILFTLEAFSHFYVGKGWDFSVLPSWKEVGEIVGITAVVSLLSALITHFVLSKIEN